MATWPSFSFIEAVMTNRIATHSGDINIREILDASRVCVHFQPLVSVKRRALLGFEALARGLDGHGRLIRPDLMFARASEEGLVLELDRLCRQAAFAAFAKVHARDKSLILSINIAPSVIEAGFGSNRVRDAAAENGIDPNNVSVEIVESRVGSLSVLESFTRRYQEMGFLITLDDVGVGHSNLDRVAYLRPDIIKIDRSLVSHIDERYHQQEIIKSLVGLSHRIGSLVIAEGIEAEAEAVTLLSLGVDVFQGFYFSRPHPYEDLPVNVCLSRIGTISAGFRKFAETRLSAKRERWKAFREMIEAVTAGLARLPASGFDDYLKKTVLDMPMLECAYVLDREGIQVSRTHCSICLLRTHRKVIFQPADVGADHSLKDYYLFVSSDSAMYITEPYISLATGNLCQTIAARFDAGKDGRFILCLDVGVDAAS